MLTPADKTDLRRKENILPYIYILVSTIHGQIQSHIEILAPTRNDKFESPDESYHLYQISNIYMSILCKIMKH